MKELRDQSPSKLTDTIIHEFEPNDMVLIRFLCMEKN